MDPIEGSLEDRLNVLEGGIGILEEKLDFLIEYITGYEVPDLDDPGDIPELAPTNGSGSSN